MLNILKLLLPALFPSWRFFDVIAPSPRIQFTLLSSEDESPSEWLEFRPRPAHLPFPQMLRRMSWNPRWNESLFMVSCAERLLVNPTQHSEDEIMNRIMAELMRNSSSSVATSTTHLQFRLLLIERQESQIEQEVVFYSRLQPLPAQGEAWS